MVLWTHSMWVYGIVNIYAEGWRFESLNHLCCLSYWMAVRHGLWISDLKRCVDAFGTKCLYRIMGYRWNCHVKPATTSVKLRPVTSLVHGCQLQLYGHVACFPDVNFTHRIVSVQGNPEWRRLRGHPHNSWLGQVDRSCQEGLGMERVEAWRLARGGMFGV